MSLFARRGLGDTSNNLVPSRAARRTGSVSVSADSALRTSAVWAALRLRADLVSTMPLDVFRRVGGIQVEVPKPPVLVNPGGDRVDMQEWLYSSQFELDRTGNVFGIISEVDALGNPRRVDLVDSATVVVRVNTNTGVVSYRIGGDEYTDAEVWHERQFTIPGLVMGLSPVAYAAWSIGQYQSAVEFGLEWFGNGAMVPGGVLRNSEKVVAPEVAAAAKTRFKEAIAGRDLFVTGKDWEFVTTEVAANESQFLDTQNFGLSDIARFFGVPGDLIDIAPSGGSSAITYASITQRNLQFLIMNLGPVFARREKALSKWLPQPRFVKFNTDALLRMDPAQRALMFVSLVNAKLRAPSEVRELDNLPPLTPEQIAEIKELGIGAAPAPAVSGGASNGQQ